MTNRPRISTVVLSYNRPAHLRDALKSIFQQKRSNQEILVVDNLSSLSNEVARVVQDFPSVRFLPQSANRGFATGMNIGIEAATGEYLHITEDDISLDDGFYDRILSIAETRQQCLFSGIIRNFPWIGNEYRGLSLEIGRHFIQEPLTSLPDTLDPYPVGMLVGAMMFGRREVFELVGGFREEYFVYFEDTELCWRARRCGIELWVVPTVAGVHTAQPPQGLQSFIEFHKLKNYYATNLLYMQSFSAAMMMFKYFSHTTVRKAWLLRSPTFLWKIWAWSAWNSWKYLFERWRGCPVERRNRFLTEVPK